MAAGGLLFTIALIGFTLSMPSAGAAWMQEKGGEYVKISLRGLLGTGRAFGADGKIRKGLPTYYDHQLNVYAEGGASDTVTLLGFATPVGRASFNGADTFYVGPIGLGARWALLDDGTHVSVQGDYSYAPRLGNGPLGSDFTAIDEEGTQRFNYFPTLENHASEAQVQAARATRWGWWSTSVGFRLNSAQGVGHALTAAAKAGTTIGRKWHADLHSTLYQPFDAVVFNNVSGVGQTAFTGVGIGLGYTLEWQVRGVVALDGVVVARSNAAAPRITIGIEFL